MELKHLFLSLDGQLPYCDGWGIVPSVGDEIRGFKVRLVQRHPVNPKNFVVIFTKAPRFRLLSSDEPHR